jgi:hypothetical protein
VSTDAPDWKALADLLVTRRVQLHPQYKNRRKFVADTHSGSSESWYRMITSIETGTRDNYGRETLAAMEVAYQLEPGSLIRSVRSGMLEPKKHEALVPQGPGEASAHEPAALEIERKVLEDLRTQAEADDKTIGDVLVERGLATPDELTLSEAKQRDRLVKEILDSDLSEDTKNAILLDYVQRRRYHFQKAGLTENVELHKK